MNITLCDYTKAIVKQLIASGVRGSVQFTIYVLPYEDTIIIANENTSSCKITVNLEIKETS